jgi:hypothetical protein
MRRGIARLLLVVLSLCVLIGLGQCSGMLGAIVGVVALFSSFGSANCELRKELARTPSPDGAWIASIYSNICSDGGLTTWYFDTVELARPHDPPTPEPSRGKVFGMDHGRDEDIREVNWTGPRTLEVTIPNASLIGTQRSDYRGVTISYKYVPDDPIERACWNQWWSLPDMDRIRGDVRVNMDNFFPRCRAVLGDISVVDDYLKQHDTIVYQLRRWLDTGFDRTLKRIEEVREDHMKREQPKAIPN